MVVRFWNEFQAIAGERTIVPDREKQPGKGQTWGQKYATTDAVLKEWTKRQGTDDGPEPLPIDLDAVLTALTMESPELF